ncbi:MAG: hypothetical protein FWF09_03000 [Bacteroidales bacterium]|nr:hypothetical protein [Bacteroidales bacterium]
MKAIYLSKIWRLVLPSLFFIVIAITYIFDFPTLSRCLIAGGIILPIFINLFLQNIIFSRILGSVFWLGSCYMMLALLSDVINGKASFGYLFVFLICLFSMAMAVLLIIGYKKKQNDDRKTE